MQLHLLDTTPQRLRSISLRATELSQKLPDMNIRQIFRRFMMKSC
ncbi:MAG TPA: hypothetical protein VE199_02155 [Nitrososphaera sp.]|nr:hypothetical protein [Nitrososphaera sp.]